MGVSRLPVSLLSCMIAMCILLSEMYCCSIANLLVVRPSALNWRIFMLFLMVSCNVYVVWLGGGGGGVVCGSVGTLVM